MTQEEKDLLLKDLCARLPYGVKYKCSDTKNIWKLNAILTKRQNDGVFLDIYNPLDLCKPYLFPLSSMTDEQKREYNYWKHEVPICHYEYGDVVEEIELLDSPASFEYLIENHFDYRGLINRGLAIDATELAIY